jgi:hypothetical protein
MNSESLLRSIMMARRNSAMVASNKRSLDAFAMMSPGVLFS